MLFIVIIKVLSISELLLIISPNLQFFSVTVHYQLNSAVLISEVFLNLLASAHQPVISPDLQFSSSILHLDLLISIRKASVLIRVLLALLVIVGQPIISPSRLFFSVMQHWHLHFTGSASGEVLFLSIFMLLLIISLNHQSFSIILQLLNHHFLVFILFLFL